MTGEKFMRISRKSERLERMVSDYYAIGDQISDLLNINEIREHGIDYEKVYKLQDKKKVLAFHIWNEAFYHYRDWNLANEFCKHRGIDY